MTFFKNRGSHLFAVLDRVFGMGRVNSITMEEDRHKSPDKESLLSEDSSSSESDLNSHTTTIKHAEMSCLSISIYSAVVIAMVCIFLVLGRDYIKYVLLSLEETNLLISFAIFAFLFTVVSFPMTWGYILLNIAAGYLYGLFLGLFIVMLCALLGLSIAHVVIKYCMRSFVIKRLTNDSVRAIMRVVDSDNGFKVVVLSRFTPIPFGLQNALYAMSNITYLRYVTASALGMMPSQGMHAYIGSTLRSMEEVISNSGSTPTAYVVFGIQLTMILVLLLYIIRRARAEFDRTMQQQRTDSTSNEKSSSSSSASSPSSPTPKHSGDNIIITIDDTPVHNYYATKNHDQARIL